MKIKVPTPTDCVVCGQTPAIFYEMEVEKYHLSCENETHKKLFNTRHLANRNIITAITFWNESMDRYLKAELSLIEGTPRVK